MGTAAGRILQLGDSFEVAILEANDDVSVLCWLNSHENCHFCSLLDIIASLVFTLGASVLLDHDLALFDVALLDSVFDRVELANIVVEPFGEVSEDLLAEASYAPNCSLLSKGVQEVDLQELWLTSSGGRRLPIR